MSGDDKCAECRILRRYHDMPEAGRDHPFRSSVIECEADETKVLAQNLHHGILEGEVSVADLAKLLTLNEAAIDSRAEANALGLAMDAVMPPLRGTTPACEHGTGNRRYLPVEEAPSDYADAVLAALRSTSREFRSLTRQVIHGTARIDASRRDKARRNRGVQHGGLRADDRGHPYRRGVRVSRRPLVLRRQTEGNTMSDNGTIEGRITADDRARLQEWVNRIAAAVLENGCGDKDCEGLRHEAALFVLRGGTKHRAYADVVQWAAQARPVLPPGGPMTREMLAGIRETFAALPEGPVREGGLMLIEELASRPDSPLPQAQR